MRKRYALPKTEYGKWMFTQMLENDLSCEDIAGKLHTTRQNIYNHMSGISKPQFVSVLAYCHIFGDKDDPEEIWKLIKNEGV